MTMDEIFKDVRPMDAVLALLLSAAGVALMAANINADVSDTKDLHHAITNQSWLMLPLFLGTTLPVLWRRRNVVAVALVSTAVMGAHVLAFDWVIRCGAGLPLSFVLAYSVGKLATRGQTFVGLGVVLAGQALALVRDSAAGLEILPFTAAIAVAAWGAGRVVQHRSDQRTELPVDTRTPVRV